MNVHILNTQNTLFKKRKGLVNRLYAPEKILWDCLIVLFKKEILFRCFMARIHRTIKIPSPWQQFSTWKWLAVGLRNSLVRVLSSWQLKNHTNSSIVPPHNTLYFLCRHCTMEVLWLWIVIHMDNTSRRIQATRNSNLEKGSGPFCKQR